MIIVRMTFVQCRSNKVPHKITCNRFAGHTPSCTVTECRPPCRVTLRPQSQTNSTTCCAHA